MDNSSKNKSLGLISATLDTLMTPPLPLPSSALHYPLSLLQMHYIPTQPHGEPKGQPLLLYEIKCAAEEVGERKAETAIPSGRKYCVDCSYAN